MRLISLQSVDPRHTGELASLASLWVPQLHRAEPVDLRRIEPKRFGAELRERETLVVVGGTTLGRDDLRDRLAHLLDATRDSARTHFVVWGAGAAGELSAADHELLARAELAGVRFADPRWVQVGDPSALHPALSLVGAPTHPTVVYAQEGDAALARAAREHDWPLLIEHGPDVGRAIAFVLSGATVLTSSYHGAYWGLVGGRRVGVVAEDGRVVDGLGLVAHQGADAVERARADARRVRGLGARCRSANLDFADRVLGLVARVGGTHAYW